MKLLTSRYAQIGLALIIVVLLLVGVSSSASAAGPVYHTVQYGQTLYSIAQWYHTSVWAIACANGLYNPNYVYAGQVLVIPGGYDGGGCKPAYKPVKHDNCDCYGNDVKYQPQHQDGYDCKCGGPERPSYPQPKDGYGGGSERPGYPQHQDGYDCKCGGGEPTKYHPQPKPLGCFYTVRWGDHLFRIALKYNVSWTVIAQANNLYNGNYIYAGQVIRVPCVW